MMTRSQELLTKMLADWGRQAADLSMFNNYTVNLCASQGQCCSSLQNNNYPAAFDSGDYGAWDCCPFF